MPDIAIKTNMTLDDVDASVAEIRQFAHDDERAHQLADKLYQDVIKSIAHGHPYPGPLATRALEVESIDFPRYHA